MSSKLAELVNLFNESVASGKQKALDGTNDYGIVDAFLKQNGIRANNKQVWSFINEAKQTAGEAADW